MRANSSIESLSVVKKYSEIINIETKSDLMASNDAALNMKTDFKIHAFAEQLEQPPSLRGASPTASHRH